MFERIVLRRQLTRRKALQLGAAAALAGAGAARPAGAAGGSGGCRVPVFELDLSRPLDASAAARGWRTLPVLRAPRRFDMLGLRWAHAGAHVHAEVRARGRNGPWTPWTALHVAAGHAPDRSRAAPGTEPAWTDSADFFQVRLKGRPSGLRVRFVRAKPTAQLARRLTPRLRARSAAAARARRPTASAAQLAPPPIITRTEWGGDSCPPREPASYGDVQVVFVHHTVTANEYTPEDSASIVLGICRYHRDNNKWNDIGYNFLVDRYGQVFEGRAGGVDQAVIGAHAQGYNSHSTGIACLGDFTAEGAPLEASEAIARLIAWKMSLHGAPCTGQVILVSGGGEANRYPYGTAVTFERISGHRDGDETSCPGDGLFTQLPALRERAAALATPISAVSLAAASTTVRHPTPLSLSGGLRFSDGAPAANEPVQIQFQAAGAAWQVLQTVTTVGDGSWTATLPAPASGLLRAVFPGDANHPPLESPAVTVRVLPRLTIALSGRRVATGQKISVKGTLTPSAQPRIELTLERLAGRRWKRVQRKRINVRGGGYDTTIRPKRAGLHRVTIRAEGATIRRQLRATNVSGGAAAG